MSLAIEVLCDAGIESPAESGQLARAAQAAARWAGYTQGDIGIRVCGDAAIQQVNRRHLGHDYPTDVISFSYQQQPPLLSGELVVSAETARRHADRFAWPGQHELMLYVVHGVLHMTGLDDQTPSQRAEMRRAETAIMDRLGIVDAVRCGADADPLVPPEPRI